MTEEIIKEGRVIVDGVNVIGCKYYLFRDEEPTSDRTCGIGLTACKGKECDYKEIKHLQRENKEKIDIISQMIKIIYPNASDDELFDVTFNGEYIDKLKELKDTADTMLMANDIKKQDIDSLREANENLYAELQKIREGKCTDCIQHLITDSHKKALAKTNSYIKALEEIRKIAEKELYLKQNSSLTKILDKINEVLDNENQ